MKKLMLVVWLVLFILIVDQAVKIYIKTHFEYGESVAIFGLPWANLHFVENEGMAFGWKLDQLFGAQIGIYGKLILSLFRIFAVGFLCYYLYSLIKGKVANGLLVSFAFILAGAIGNILDSAFYGIIFSESPYHGGEIARMFPPEGGYAPFLHGKVVDMFYFPLFHGRFPSWLPIWGSEDFEFFRPVFNVADAAITIGVLSIILFQRHHFTNDTNNLKTPPSTENTLIGAAEMKHSDDNAAEITV